LNTAPVRMQMLAFWCLTTLSRHSFFYDFPPLSRLNTYLYIHICNMYVDMYPCSLCACAFFFKYMEILSHIQWEKHQTMEMGKTAVRRGRLVKTFVCLFFCIPSVPVHVRFLSRRRGSSFRSVSWRFPLSGNAHSNKLSLFFIVRVS
jgi:hypothetical protein